VINNFHLMEISIENGIMEEGWERIENRGYIGFAQQNREDVEKEIKGDKRREERME
jgi:hypothetical protein